MLTRRKRVHDLPPIPWTLMIKSQLDRIQTDIYHTANDIQALLFHLNCIIKEQHDKILEMSEYSNLQHRKSQMLEIINLQLYNDIEDKNMKLSHCLNSLHFSSTDEEDTMCECCCVHYNKKSMLQCSLGHFICKNCVDHQCKLKLESLDEICENIPCLSLHDCTGSITSFEVGRTKHGRDMLNEYAFSKYKYMLQQYMTSFTKEDRDRNFCFLQSDGTFRALQCPQCDYGPILHQFCDDLEIHHNQRVGEKSNVSNVCPNCNYFSSSVSSFVRWNGQFQPSNSNA
jgi:hypothetical protein